MLQKFILTTTFLLGATTLLHAQEIKEDSTILNKLYQPCVSATYAMSGEIVEGAFLKKLAEAKITKSSKANDGFKVYKAVSIQEITKETLDMYYRVDDKKTSATLSILLSKGYDNFMKSTTDSLTIANAKTYLSNFIKDVNRFSLNKQIEEQNDKMNGLEKDLKGQIKDEESYTKDKGKIESKISSNKIDSEALKADMEVQQKALELVKQKTATIEQMDALKKEVKKQEDISEKASKKYNKSLENGSDLREDLKKAEDKIANSALEQTKTKASIDAVKKVIADLQNQLSNIK